jgi:PIN domain nuclease of toxin-antitoxin system
MHQGWANDDLRKVQSGLQQYLDITNNMVLLSFNSIYTVNVMYNLKKLAKEIKIQNLKEIYVIRYLLYIFTTFIYTYS